MVKDMVTHESQASNQPPGAQSYTHGSATLGPPSARTPDHLENATAVAYINHQGNSALSSLKGQVFDLVYSYLNTSGCPLLKKKTFYSRCISH